MRYLDPKNDLTFKKIFGEHPDILLDLLNSFLPFEKGNQIESLEYLPSEQVPFIPGLKNSIVDVKCKDLKKRQFIVEMQILWTDDFKKRVVFNASKAYIKPLEKGGEYTSLKPVYAVNLVADIFDNETEEYFHYYEIVNTINPEKKLEGLSFLFIELPKITAQNLPKEKAKKLWLRFFSEIKDGTIEIPTELKKYKPTKQALDLLEESSFSAAQLEYYDHYWDEISRERTIVESLRIATVKLVEKEILLETKDKELETKNSIIETKNSIIETKDKELEEAKNQMIEMVKSMKKDGLSIDIIAKYIELSKEEIENL